VRLDGYSVKCLFAPLHVTCRDWILRNINRPDFFPRGSRNKTELAVRTAAFLRVATQELGREIAISIVIDPRTSRYSLDPRTLTIGPAEPDAEGRMSVDLLVGAYGAGKVHVPGTWAGTIHSHPDNLFGVHGGDQDLARRHTSTVWAKEGDFDAYVVTRAGAVCRYTRSSGSTIQVGGPAGSRPTGDPSRPGEPIGCGP